MEPKPKKKKTSTSPTFKPEWEAMYGICQVSDGRALCVICGEYFTCIRTSNFRRHYENTHEDFGMNFPFGSAMRAHELYALKTKFETATKLKLFNLDSLSSTKLSLGISYLIAKEQKPYDDSEFVKKSLMTAAKILYTGTEYESKYLEFFENVPLSRHTCRRRIELIGNDITEQLYGDFENSVFFSLQLDESTNVTNTVQLLVFVRLVFHDLSIKEELVAMISLQGCTTGEDIMSALKPTLDRLPLNKLVSVTTDGSKSMTGKYKNLIILLKKNPLVINLKNFHCAIHQQALCMKSLSIPDVENVVIKIINSIRAHATQHKLFKTFSEERNLPYRDSKYYNEVKWLSKGTMFDRFYENITIIDEFLAQKNEPRDEFKDFRWISTLAFLVDLSMIVNEKNLGMQGPNKFYWEILRSIEQLKYTLKTSIESLKINKIPIKFPRLMKIQKESGDKMNDLSNEFINKLEILLTSLNERFLDFMPLWSIFDYLQYPFDESKSPDDITKTIIEFDPTIDPLVLSTELHDLKCDFDYKNISNIENKLWTTIISKNAYPTLCNVYRQICSCFGSTYLCESGFSRMKFTKNIFRYRLAGDHLQYSLRISTSNYEPDLDSLAWSIINNESL